MMKQVKTKLLVGLLVAGAAFVQAQPTPADDPTGIIKKPIPERLVVVTFDDGCASHATIAAPILKKHGFGGTFMSRMPTCSVSARTGI